MAYLTIDPYSAHSPVGRQRAINQTDGRVNMTRKRVTGFSATGSDGKTYTVNVYANVVGDAEMTEVSGLLGDPTTWDHQASIDGIDSSYQLVRLEKGKYRIGDSDITLTSNDPKAV